MLDAYIASLEFRGLEITDAVKLMLMGFEIPKTDITQLWEIFGKYYYKKNQDQTVFVNAGFLCFFLGKLGVCSNCEFEMKKKSGGFEFCIFNVFSVQYTISCVADNTTAFFDVL